MNVLVTGGGGQVAQALVACLPQATALSRAELDISDADSVRAAMDKHQPEVLINCAAWTNVDDAESHPEEAFCVNALGPRWVAEETKRIGARLIHLSTDFVFDGTLGRAYREDDAPHPLSVYGETKLAGEREVLSLRPDALVVRTAWVYSHVGTNFIKTMHSLAKRDEVRVVSDQIGSPTYAPHLAAALVTLAQTSTPPTGILHLGGSGSCSRAALAEALFRQLGSTTRVIPIPTSEMPRPAARPGFAPLASQQTQYRLPPWEEGLRAYVQSDARAR